MSEEENAEHTNTHLLWAGSTNGDIKISGYLYIQTNFLKNCLQSNQIHFFMYTFNFTDTI